MFHWTLFLLLGLVGPVDVTLVGELASERFLHLTSVDAIARDRDNDQILSCASGGQVVLWDERSGQRLGAVQLDTGRAVSLAALAPGRWLIGDSTDRLFAVEWDAEKQNLRALGLGPMGLADLADVGGGFQLSPDRQRLAVWGIGGAGGDLMLVDFTAVSVKAEGARRVLGLDGLRADSAVWSFDGRFLAVMATNARKVIGRAGTKGQDSSRVYVFDVASGERVQRINSPDELLHGIAFGPNGSDGARLLVTGGALGLRLFELAEGRQLSHFGDLGSVRQISVSTDGQSLVALADNGKVELWSLSSNQEPKLLSTRDLGRGVAVVLLGEQHLVAAQGQRIRRWRLDDWSLEPAIAGHSGRLAVLAAHGESVLSVGLDGSAFLWDEHTKAGQSLITADTGLILDAGLSRDGSRLTTSGQDTGLRTWSLDPGDNFGRELSHQRGRTSASFTGVAYSPLGDILAAVSADGILWIFNAEDGALQRTFDGLAGLDFKLAFSSDGGQLAVGSSGVRIWDTTTWQLTCSVPVLKSPITGLAFSPSGAELAVALARKVVVTIGVADGEVLATSEPLPARVAGLVYFSGALAVSSDRLGGIRILDGALKQVGFLASKTKSDIVVLARSGGKLLAGDQQGRIWIWE